MTRRRRSRGLVILIFAVVLLLLAEGALVAFVFISPNASKQLEGVGVTAQRVWEGSDGQPGLRGRAVETARTVYQRWVEPLWQEVAVSGRGPALSGSPVVTRKMPTAGGSA